MRRSERQKLRAARAERRAATPLAGAIAGILFAVLFSLSVAIIETSMTICRTTPARGSTPAPGGSSSRSP